MARRSAPPPGGPGGAHGRRGRLGGIGTYAPGPLITPSFHHLADFANFRLGEAQMLRDCAPDMAVFIESVAGDTAAYLLPRLAASGIEASIEGATIATWLTQTCGGPFDGHFANHIRALSHLDGGVTFPGVSAPMPPQMVVATMAWVQGQILLALGNVTDAITLSGLGGIWMDQLLLQLSIMLEPVLGEPTGPRPEVKGGHAAVLHPYAELAGFGAAQGKVLEETGMLLSPLADGVISLAYSYLLSRPESAGYFQDSEHLAQRKRTLKAWWVRTASDPYEADAAFGDYLRKVANAHVRNAGTHPDVEIPAHLTIALMAWVEMRVMAALNTVTMALDSGGSGPFSVFGGDPGVLASVARAWMAMLTLQLGVLIDPYFR